MTAAQALLLVVQGAVCGLVLAQMVSFTKRGDKVFPHLDESPVPRTLLAAVALVGLIVTLRLVHVDIDTRACIEETRAALSDVRTGQTPPLPEQCDFHWWNR